MLLMTDKVSSPRRSCSLVHDEASFGLISMRQAFASFQGHSGAMRRIPSERVVDKGTTFGECDPDKSRRRRGVFLNGHKKVDRELNRNKQYAPPLGN
jgi:hypothetical protein